MARFSGCAIVPISSARESVGSWVSESSVMTNRISGSFERSANLDREAVHAASHEAVESSSLPRFRSQPIHTFRCGL